VPVCSAARLPALAARVAAMLHSRVVHSPARHPS
jgi:hypothetical protein